MFTPVLGMLPAPMLASERDAPAAWRGLDEEVAPDARVAYQGGAFQYVIPTRTSGDRDVVDEFEDWARDPSKWHALRNTATVPAPGQCLPAGDGSRDLQLNWLEEQIVRRLQRLEAKIDELATRGDVGNRGGSRQNLLYPRKKTAAIPVVAPWEKRTPRAPPGAGWAMARGAHRSGPLHKCEPQESLRMPVGEENEFTADAPSPATFRSSGVNWDEAVQVPPLVPGSPPAEQTDAGDEEEVAGHASSSTLQRSGSIGSTSSAGFLVLHARAKQFPQWRERMFRFLNDAEHSTASHCYHVAENLFIWFSLVFFAVSTLAGDPLFPSGFTAAVEMGIEAVFLVQATLRFYCSPSRWHFFENVYNLIDCAASLPLLVRVAVGCEMPPEDSEGGLLVARNALICVVPVVRVLKVMRGFEHFQLLLKAFALSFEALPVCMYTLLLITVAFSSTVYLVEPRDNIESLAVAVWFTMVTMTTVGYGDITPASTAGSIVVSVLVICSVLYMAMPLGMIGQAFTCVWSDRDRVLLLKHTRERLTHWGYSATDIIALFQMFDENGNGELEVDEFEAMINEMRIGLTHDRVMELFTSFDQDGSGSIDDKEFLKALYPADFDKVYINVEQEKEVKDAKGMEQAEMCAERVLDTSIAG